MELWTAIHACFPRSEQKDNRSIPSIDENTPWLLGIRNVCTELNAMYRRVLIHGDPREEDAAMHQAKCTAKAIRNVYACLNGGFNLATRSLSHPSMAFARSLPRTEHAPYNDIRLCFFSHERNVGSIRAMLIRMANRTRIEHNARAFVTFSHDKRLYKIDKQVDKVIVTCSHLLSQKGLRRKWPKIRVIMRILTQWRNEWRTALAYYQIFMRDKY